MKLIGIISIAVLSLTLGVAAPVYAQQDRQEEEKAKPSPEEKKPQPGKPAKQQKDNRAGQDKGTKLEQKNARQEKASKPEKKTDKQEKNTKPEQTNAKQEKITKPEENNARQTKPAQSAQGAQRGDDNGRIPDDRFKDHFGREHTFRVTQGDYSNRRFQYGGYSFGFVGPWPSNWLYSQDVYVMDINGVYYLCNPMYPNANIALSIAL